jgi:hypothetical protein
VQWTAYFSKQQQPLQFLVFPVHEVYIVIHSFFSFMRVIFGSWGLYSGLWGVICFSYSMLTKSFPRERDVVKKKSHHYGQNLGLSIQVESQSGSKHPLLKSLILYQALLKYNPLHRWTLSRGELDKEGQAGGHNFLPVLTKYY